MAFPQGVVAGELAHLGLRPGDEIATVGDAFTAYYAKLAHLQVVANIGFRGELADGWYDTDRFWSLSDSDFHSLEAELRRIGVKAIVSPEKCNVAPSARWHSIKDTGYCVELLTNR